MAAGSPTYDLVLLLDPQAEEPAHAKIVADTKATITAHGEVTRHDQWGERALAYPIDHHATAEYHLLQFTAAQTSLIAELNRALHITDGVIRFRINKLQPGTPDAPDMKADRGGAREAAPAREDAGQASAEEPAAA